MAELSSQRILELLHAIWRPLSLPEEIYYLPYSTEESSIFNNICADNYHGKLPGPFRILPPTAMALMTLETAEITIIPTRNALCIPKYQTVDLMIAKLNAFIDSTNNL